jgi:hypothetical protein
VDCLTHSLAAKPLEAQLLLQRLLLKQHGFVVRLCNTSRADYRVCLFFPALRERWELTRACSKETPRSASIINPNQTEKVGNNRSLCQVVTINTVPRAREPSA